MMVRVSVSREKYNEAFKWCKEQFGNHLGRWWTDIEPLYDEEFIFESEEDATLFIMRWV